MQVFPVANVPENYPQCHKLQDTKQKYFARQQMHLGEINGHVEEIYAGHTVVKAYNGEESARKKFEEIAA